MPVLTDPGSCAHPRTLRSERTAARATEWQPEAGCKAPSSTGLAGSGRSILAIPSRSTSTSNVSFKQLSYHGFGMSTKFTFDQVCRRQNVQNQYVAQNGMIIALYLRSAPTGDRLGKCTTCPDPIGRRPRSRFLARIVGLDCSHQWQSEGRSNVSVHGIDRFDCAAGRG